jgi:hypothetical protein
VVSWTWDLSREGWLGFVATTSHVATLPDAERAAYLAEVDALLPDRVGLAWETVCVRWWP